MYKIAYRFGLFAIVLLSATWTVSASGERFSFSSAGGMEKISPEAAAAPTCPNGANCCGLKANDTLGPGGADADLLVLGGVCTVKASATLNMPAKYLYHNINIYDGGILQFSEGATELWAANILVEKGGTLRAGVAPNGAITPIAGPLVIRLYGRNQGPGGVGVPCMSSDTCGVPDGPDGIWNSNSTAKMFPASCKPSDLPGGVKNQCFYAYDAMPFDNGKFGPTPTPTATATPSAAMALANGMPGANSRIRGAQPFGYFGYKVLGVGYGGTLQLYGKKGATYDTVVDPKNTGKSWVRLNNCAPETTPKDLFCNQGTLTKGATTLTLSSDMLDWQPEDYIVISSTDYLPGHAEKVQIKSRTNARTFVIKSGLNFPHNASTYSLSKITGPQKPTGWTSVDTRASVALLTRSIRIESGGNAVLSDFDPPPPPPVTPQTQGYYFGGHMVIRQGFEKVQIQGVEFHWMGQGGRIGHYPVHFHMARQVPKDTFLKDNSVWDSMTRWYVLHATQGVLLARNVGYASIGHGYYLEDGTETDNKLYANIGIFARAAITNAQNPRNVPGILAAPDYPIICDPKNGCRTASPSNDVVPYHSDWDHPSVFWIMNGWNDFEYNMAAGTGTCGSCYWLLPGINSGMSRNMKWESYASEQQLPDSKTSGGTTPLQIFTGNSCVSSMASFLTVGNTTACNGVQIGPNRNNPNYPVLNPSTALSGSPDFNLAPSSQSGTTPDSNGFSQDNYYPHVGGGGRFPTKCPASGDCSTKQVCDDKNQADCMITAIDHYTTSFNWPETNFAAIWLRPQWYLFINSVISDVQNGGITFVTGGGYTAADVINGHWALARKDVFIGNTQDPAASGGFASNVGPFNPKTKLKCGQNQGFAAPGNYCLSADDGVAFAISNLANNQRLFSIYDGPAYQDTNAYLDIQRANLDNDSSGCQPQAEDDMNDNHNCANSDWSQAGKILGMPYDPINKVCYLPNAAIAWKQPNGFFYPPAFHSRKLFFNNVDIRHFVIEPLFDPTKGLFQTDGKAARARYCTYNSTMFTGFTDIDRQTELNDDDGTLTGLIGPKAQTGLQGSISVNQDAFFQAPQQTAECLSDVDVTPDRYKNTKVYPGTAITSPYDYVTTVVFPECAAKGAKTKCKDLDQPWDEDCANQNCYGVPLYRENVLTGEKATPIRLMGQSKFQRSSLTTNNNTYYIDTTPSKNAQLNPPGINPGISHVNVFIKNQTYYVFLLFAKFTTKQTYDLYVGPGFNKDS